MTEAHFGLTRNRSRKLDRVLFRGLVALTYPLFFVTAVVSRCVPGGAERGDSVFTQALRRSEAAIAIAFAG
jgi:hypothetical protein